MQARTCEQMPIRPNASSLPEGVTVADTPGQALFERFVNDGYYVIERAFDKDFIDILRVEYSDALQRKVRRFSLKPATWDEGEPSSTVRVLNDFRPSGGNHDVNRWNMHLPSETALFDERLFANPRVLELIDTVMGKQSVCYLLASDTPYPGAATQGAHQDFSRFSIAVNIPLVDVEEQNAPLEVWPGTHRPDGGTGVDAFSIEPYLLSAERIQRIVATIPSRRLLLKAGSALVRDHRLVHRGTANVSKTARPMLSIYYVLPRPVPFRWAADLGVRLALALRRQGRGRGEQIQRPHLFTLGNVLGRVVEEYSLTDRDYRRRLSSSSWNKLTPRAQHLLRFASVEGFKRPSYGTFVGTALFFRGFAMAVNGFTMAAIKHRPRQPDEENH